MKKPEHLVRSVGSRPADSRKKYNPFTDPETKEIIEQAIKKQSETGVLADTDIVLRNEEGDERDE